jgi:hypothetical protein
MAAKQKLTLSKEIAFPGDAGKLWEDLAAQGKAVLSIRGTVCVRAF